MSQNKKIIIGISVVFILIITIISIFSNNEDSNLEQCKKLEVTLLSIENEELVFRDNSNIIYTVNTNKINANIGDKVLIEYTGLLDKNKDFQNISIVNYETIPTSNEDKLPETWKDDSIFSNYYTLAYNKLKTLSLDEKIGQLILARYPGENSIDILKEYNLGGFVFFEKDFKDKTEQEIRDMINNLQEASKIPILTAVDEEGGKIVRISNNTNLIENKFPSSKELYTSGGFEAIKEDTIKKSKFLNNLGINLNLAPVVDVSNNPNDYMYERTIGENTKITSDYAKTVIEASKGTKVSYTLKHFPGYGNNDDTHTSIVTDNRSYDDILNNDIPPFKNGIDSGAEAVLVSHNIVTSIDPNNPASLSISIHNLLRNELKFTGVVITDDLAMNATSSIEKNAVKALIAGNDLIITTDYIDSIEQIKNAVTNEDISEDLIDRTVFRILSWKYFKGLMFDEK